MPRPTSQDLAGYWDMLQLSVEDVSMKFGELHQLKQNGWKALESPEREVLSPEGPRGPCAAQAEASAGPRSCAGTRAGLWVAARGTDVFECVHTCLRVCSWVCE